MELEQAIQQKSGAGESHGQLYGQAAPGTGNQDETNEEAKA